MQTAFVDDVRVVVAADCLHDGQCRLCITLTRGDGHCRRARVARVYGSDVGTIERAELTAALTMAELFR